MNKVIQYQNIQVMTADPVRLVIMLYDGVLRFNKLAQKAIEANDVEGRNNYINRSLAIIGELGTTLNMSEGGEVARNLSRLYEFSTVQLTGANMKNDLKAIESVNRVIGELKAGWEAIASERTQEAQEPRRSISCGA